MQLLWHWNWKSFHLPPPHVYVNFLTQCVSHRDDGSGIQVQVSYLIRQHDSQVWPPVSPLLISTTLKKEGRGRCCEPRKTEQIYKAPGAHRGGAQWGHQNCASQPGWAQRSRRGLYRSYMSPHIEAISPSMEAGRASRELPLGTYCRGCWHPARHQLVDGLQWVVYWEAVGESKKKRALLFNLFAACWPVFYVSRAK